MKDDAVRAESARAASFIGVTPVCVRAPYRDCRLPLEGVSGAEIRARAEAGCGGERPDALNRTVLGAAVLTPQIGARGHAQHLAEHGREGRRAVVAEIHRDRGDAGAVLQPRKAAAHLGR